MESWQAVEDQWLLLEHKQGDDDVDLFDLPTIEDRGKSKVRAERLQRRRFKKEQRIYESYERLSALPDATDFVTRDLFFTFMIPDSVREEYCRLHKVVGPGATNEFGFATIFRGPGELGKHLQFDVRKNGSIIIPLAVAISHPSALTGKLSPGEIFQLRRRAAVNPNAAAEEAQLYIRRRSKGQEVVVVGDLNRSVKACSSIIEEFARKTVKAYDHPIETVVEGNWVQMFGPNGITDWSIAMPMSRMRTLKAVYNMLIVMGCDVVRFFFETELAVLSAVLIDYGDKLSPPEKQWMPCAADDTEDCHDSVPDEQLVVSAGSLAQGQMTTLETLSPACRWVLKEKENNIVAVMSGAGRQYGNAVDLGCKALVTCTHVADKVAPPSVARNQTDPGPLGDLTLLDTTDLSECTWQVREPLVGEFCAYMFVESGEVQYSSPVVLLSDDLGYITTSFNDVMRKGTSGAALVSTTDGSLLGIYLGVLDGTLRSVKIGPSQRKILIDVRHRDALASNINTWWDDLVDKGKEPSLNKIITSFIDYGDRTCLITPTDLLDCAPSLSLENRRQLVGNVSKPIAQYTIREPEESEVCMLLMFSSDEVKFYVPRRRSDHLSDSNSEFTAGESTNLGMLVSVQDMAVTDFVHCTSAGLMKLVVDVDHTLNTAFQDIETNVYDEVFGNGAMHKLGKDLLRYLVRPESVSDVSKAAVKESNNCALLDMIDRLSEGHVEKLYFLLNGEFFLNMVGTAIISKTFFSLLHDDIDNLLRFSNIKKKTIFLIHSYLVLSVDAALYDCYIQHISLVLQLEPT